MIGGSFGTVGGVSRPRIARLWPNGALDTSFQNTGASGSAVYCLAIQSDGRIVIGGDFSIGSSRVGLARLLANGALDGSFVPRSFSNVKAVAVQSDNKVIIGGGSTSIGYVYRLNGDGSLENTFTNYWTAPNKEVLAVAVQPDGKILIGGSFTAFNGTTRNYLARLDSDGWPDPSFLFNMTGVSRRGASAVSLCSRMARYSLAATLALSMEPTVTGSRVLRVLGWWTQALCPRTA